MAHPRVVDHHVGHAVRRAHLGRELLHRRGIGHVEAIAVGLGALGSYPPRGFGQTLLVDVADHDVGAGTRKRQRGLAADAAAGTGHRHQVVGEGLARSTDLGAPQLPRGRGAPEMFDELGDRTGQHLRV